MTQLKEFLDDGQRVVAAELVGAAMHQVIVHPLVEAVRTDSIEREYTFSNSMTRWIEAMQFLNSPALARALPPIVLEGTTTAALERESVKLKIPQNTAVDLKNHPALVPALRPVPRLRTIVAADIDQLLRNGGVDTMGWIGQLRKYNVPIDAIAEHPVFSSATSLTSASHSIAGTWMQTAPLMKRPTHMPRSRGDLLKVVHAAPPSLEVTARIMHRDVRPLDVSGFCPASRMRDIQGTTWLSALVDRTADLYARTVED